MIPKIVFFGTPQFSATVLKFLYDSDTVDIASVITRTDKPSKRSIMPVSSPVKELAISLGIPVFQPIKCSTESFVEVLRSIEADLFIVVAYGEIIRQNVLDLPRFGCLNVHAGLLPAYRGAAPVQRAIMNGETLSGLTVIRMDAGMDTGAILSQEIMEIKEDMTSGDLLQSLSLVAGPLLTKTISGVVSGQLIGVAQDESKVSFAPKILKEESRISWDIDSSTVYNKIRALLPTLLPWSAIQIKREEKKLFFHEVLKSNVRYDLPPGTILRPSKSEMVIVCREGSIIPIKVQIESKKILHIKDFLNGISDINTLTVL
ncbi:MAG: methionyl-tRNA formyltransferase [Victivallaceae bacterium]